MDNNIKNFDRAIEQRLNELQTPPPFGAWNRIAAELDAMPMAEPAPVNNLLPKRVITSFIAGMVIMGAAIGTGFWLNTALNHDKNVTAVSNVVKTENVASTLNKVQANEVIKAVTPAPAAKLPVPVAANRKTAVQPVERKTIVASVVNNTKVNDEVTANTISDVPSPIQAPTLPASELKETYYFPPVDIITPEKCKAETTDEVKIAKPEEAKVTTDNDDRKGDSKIKIKRQHRRSWGYGNINRI